MTGSIHDDAPAEEFPWRDRQRMEQLYVDQHLSSRQIADRLGCSKQTVLNWLDRFGVEKRTSDREKPPNFRTMSGGYEEVRTTIGDERDQVYIHRLLAVAEHGFDAVCDRVVHHKNEIPWDNRPENIELMTPEEHIREHKPSKGWV